MIDLRLHDARYLAVPLGAEPHLPLRQEGECAQPMHGGMIVICNMIGQRQGRWIEDPGLTPEQQEMACCLLDAQARVGTLATASVEQQAARRGIVRQQAHCRDSEYSTEE